MTYHIQSELEGPNDNLEDFWPCLTFCWHCLVLPRRVWIFTAMRAHCWLIFNLFIRMLRSFLIKLLSSCLMPASWCLRLFLLGCQTQFPIVKSHVFFSQIVHPVRVFWKAVQPPDASFTLPSFVRFWSQFRVHCVLYSRSVMKMLHQYRVLGCLASDWPTGELCATGHNTLCPADQPLFSPMFSLLI